MTIPSERSNLYLYRKYNEEKNLENSSNSRQINKFNLPEVKKVESKFVYNFFKRDERVAEYQNNVIITKDNFADVTFEITTDKLPRYVDIRFGNITSTLDDKFELGNLNPVVLTNSVINDPNVFNYINYEGARFNPSYSGVELIDTNRESKIYTILKSNMYFKNIDPFQFTQKESAQLLYETLEEKGGLYGADKKLIIEAFNNIQSEGFEYAPTDVSIEKANASKDPISQQSFSVQFNNLLMEQLLFSSNTVNDSVYSDEIRGLAYPAKILKEKIINNPLYTIYNNSEIGYDIQLTPLRIFDVSNPFARVTAMSRINQPKFVGFLVEKYEVFDDESSVLVYKKILRGNHTRFVDPEVRYGSFYTYKIRTLFEYVAEVNAFDPSDGSLSQNVIAGFILASDGIVSNVHTIERIPPPPPVGLRFKFDYVTLFPEIHWQFPLNKQRDIKKFQVFKRLSVREPFTLIAELDFDDSLSRTVNSELPVKSTYFRLERPVLSFLDKTHKEGEIPIYAVASVDAHGYGSNYSIQVAIQRDELTNRVNRQLISRSGAPKPYPNIYINQDSFQDVVKTSGLDRISLFFDPEYFKVYRNSNISQGEEIDLNFLAIDNNNPRYLFHFINIDNHKDQKLFVKIRDESSPNNINEFYFQPSPVSTTNLQNLSFN